MKLLILLVNFALVLTVWANKSAEKIYGIMPSKGKAITLAEAIKQSQVGKNKKILLQAQITKVCKKKGCWFGVKEKNIQARVIFSKYGFMVPQKMIGKQALIEGVIKYKEISVKRARHFAEDEGWSELEIKKITKPQKKYTIVADGVAITL